MKKRQKNAHQASCQRHEILVTSDKAVRSQSEVRICVLRVRAGGTLPVIRHRLCRVSPTRFFCEWSLHPRLHSTSFRLSEVTEIVCLWHTKIKMLYIVLIITYL